MREVGRYVRPGKAGVTVCGMGVFWHTAAMKIYTKAGDDGMTSLLGGTRVAKDAPRVEAYGTVDELNAALGLAASVPVTAEARSILHLLHRLQHLLFDLGADLAAPGHGSPIPSAGSLRRMSPKLRRRLTRPTQSCLRCDRSFCPADQSWRRDFTWPAPCVAGRNDDWSRSRKWSTRMTQWA